MGARVRTLRPASGPGRSGPSCRQRRAGSRGRATGHPVEPHVSACGGRRSLDRSVDGHHPLPRPPPRAPPHRVELAGHAGSHSATGVRPVTPVTHRVTVAVSRSSTKACWPSSSGRTPGAFRPTLAPRIPAHPVGPERGGAARGPEAAGLSAAPADRRPPGPVGLGGTGVSSSASRTAWRSI